MSSAFRRRISAIACVLWAAGGAGCGNGDRDELDTSFAIPRSEPFAPVLSAYELFDGPMAELAPASDVLEYELASPLFTDYSSKQRLLKLPPGTQIRIVGPLSASFPEGTVVAKTFYYPRDLRKPAEDWRILETRLLVLRDGLWNVATYRWNAAQTEATLLLDGEVTPIDWIAEGGQSRSTDYEVPGEVACVTCHQRSGEVTLIGLRPRNLNIAVLRDGVPVNQLEDLRARGLLADEGIELVATLPAYEDSTQDLEARARAYLDTNCAHCHNPDAWRRSARQDFDFRYETPLASSGISSGREDIRDVLIDGEMPLTGTTVPHAEGIELVLSYLDTL